MREKIILRDFRTFMMQHRVVEHQRTEFMAVKEAFDCGWNMGFDECTRVLGYLNLMLCGVLFIVVGIMMHV